MIMSCTIASALGFEAEPIALNAIFSALTILANAIKFALLATRLATLPRSFRQQSIDVTIGDGLAERPAKQRAHVKRSQYEIQQFRTVGRLFAAPPGTLQH